MCMNKDDKTHYYREDVFTFHIILFLIRKIFKRFQNFSQSSTVMTLNYVNAES